MERLNFDESSFKEGKTYKDIGSKYSSGQVVIIGGSKLFHGAPVLSLRGASRMVSMTYFASFEEDKGVADKIKASLSSFVWVPRDDLENYIEKSDAILIGPGLMRSHTREHGFVCDDEGSLTRKMTLGLFDKFPGKKWIVDGGSLQVVKVSELPKGAAVTPNEKEFEMIFGVKMKPDLAERMEQIRLLAEKYKLVILTKGEVNLVSDGVRVFVVEGGNEGLVKGGVGDVIAGVALGFAAKNDLVWSLCASSLLVKRAAERLASERGFMFNADDLVEKVGEVFLDISANLA